MTFWCRRCSEQSAVGVGQHLELDVARARDVTLEDQARVAEGVLGLAARGGQGLGQVGGLAYHAHTLAASAGRGLDQQRPADAPRFTRQLGIIVRALVAGYHRHAIGLHPRAGAAFVAHRVDGLGGRADKHQPGIRHGAREGGVFREETVAGVNGLRAGFARGLQNALDIQVGVARGGWADVNGFIRQAHVQRGAVSVGIDGHAGNAHLAAGADDAHGNFSPVGDQDFCKQCGLTCGTRQSARERAAT